MQGFLELTQLKELKLASDKLKLKRSLPINGTEAMPEKKLFKVHTNFNVHLYLHIINRLKPINGKR